MDKSVLITGGARRIGRHIALHMADNGWRVAVHYNSSESDVLSLQEENSSIAIVKADLTDIVAVGEMVDMVVEKIGPINCLINNASHFANDDIRNMDVDVWNQHMQVNTAAPLILCKKFVEQLAGQDGNIVNILDYCVLNLPDKFLSYVVSKSALWTATQILARQLAPHVRVNGIGPGHCLPNINETDESFERAYMATPLQKKTATEEICTALDCILACPSMTGQIMLLDGGKHLLGAEFY